MKKINVLATALGLAFLTSTATFAQDGKKPEEKKEHKTVKEDVKEMEKKHEREKRRTQREES